MDFFLQYIRWRRKVIIGFFICFILFMSSFALYHLPLMAVIYPMLLSCLGAAVFAVVDGYSAWRKHGKLMHLLKLPAELIDELPPVETQEDKDYQAIIRLLREQQAQLKNKMELRFADMMDYYTAWVHQIKTPIASMRLNLQNEDSEFSRKVAEDLQRIEQYVEMVLAFLRLDSESTDYVICSCDLDGIVKGVIRKLSTQFIRRKIRLQYDPLRESAITDEKWLAFVVEQVLSNALKYTQNGTVSIFMEQPKTLCIQDTGIGIAAEDLPRVFEKGYTGYNGRSDKRASGIGLYLCKRVCDNLGHTIMAESALGSGTIIRICLDQRKLEVE
ncbi:MAG: HAMP domain-containing histidine kinase [Clostridiales bacterium]|nr:HAMP domain-containing histidine kinase [Clostridiales bacterium]